jgi:phosphoglycolate phosphatase-like HAD superfamily hydrolase
MEDIKKNWGKPWNFFVTSVWPEVDLQKFTDAWRNVYRTLEYKAIEGAIDVVKGNSQYVQGVFTGRERESVEKRLPIAGFDPEWFRFVEIVSEGGNYTKEDPDSFLPVITQLEQCNIKPQETVYVDDSVFGYLGARSHGFIFVAALTGPHTMKDFLDAGLNRKMVLQSVAQLPEFLRVYGSGHSK